MKFFLGFLALIILIGVGGGAYFLYVKSLPVANRPVIVREITKEVVVRTGGKVEDVEPPQKPKIDPVEELNKKIDSLNKQLAAKNTYLESLRAQMTQTIGQRDSMKQGFSRGKSLSTISKDQSDIHQKEQLTQNLVKTQNSIRELKYQINAEKRKLWRLKKKIAIQAESPSPTADTPATGE